MSAIHGKYKKGVFPYNFCLIKLVDFMEILKDLELNQTILLEIPSKKCN